MNFICELQVFMLRPYGLNSEPDENSVPDSSFKRAAKEIARAFQEEAIMTTNGDKAADRYAARVDAVLAQRTRLRGPQPPGDLFAGLPSDHPLIKADPRRPLDPNLEIIASYVEPDDVIVDVGGGAGRISLPLAMRCGEVINVEPSPAMG